MGSAFPLFDRAKQEIRGQLAGIFENCVASGVLCIGADARAVEATVLRPPVPLPLRPVVGAVTLAGIALLPDDVLDLYGLRLSSMRSAAVAAGKLLGLSASQLSHCISMAVVPNIILHKVSTDYKTMYKSVASGHAGRAGVFARENDDLGYR